MNKLFKPAGFFLFISILLICFAYHYLHREMYIFFWDYQHYHDIALKSENLFLSGQFKELFGTLDSDYGPLFTLPHLFFAPILGSGRTVFILTNVLFYLLPFGLVTGLICRGIFPAHPQGAFLTGSIVALLSPSAWATTLRGFPDIGGAVLVGVAILAIIQDTELRKVRTPLIVGFSLALAIVFRRHYAYGALALFLSMGILLIPSIIVKVKHISTEGVRFFMGLASRMGLALLTLLAVLFLLAPNFTTDALSFSEGMKYSSYKDPAGLILRELVWMFGPVPLVIAAFGLASLLVRKDVNPLGARLILTFCLIWIALWCLVVRYPAGHYMSQALPFGIALGISTIVNPLRKKQTAAKLLVNISIVALFCASFAYSFIFPLPGMGGVGWPRIYPPKDFPNVVLPRTFPPIFRTDIAELNALGETILSVISDNRSRVLVAASSVGLNPSIAKRLLDDKKKLAEVIDTPQVDSRDWMPLGELLSADIVVVPSRPLFHLSPGEQTVVDIIRKAFAESWPISTAFERLPQTVTLTEQDGPVVIAVYLRQRILTPELISDTWERMRQNLPRPNTQMVHIFATSIYPTSMKPIPAGNPLHLHPAQAGAPVPTQIYIYKDNATSLRFNLLDDRCRGIRLRSENAFTQEIRQPERAFKVNLADIAPAAGDTYAFVLEGLDETPESIYFCSTSLIIQPD